MKLPNGANAVIDEEKLMNYLLDPLHRYGRHHAELFRRLVGIDRDSWALLDAALRKAAMHGDATAGKPSEFGTKYEIRFSMTGPTGNHTILSVWMIRSGESIPRLITAYVE
jgi:uncharacterized protein DUF6883